MKKVTFLFDSKVEDELEALKERLMTSNVSYIVRLSVHEKFLSQKISNEISENDYSSLAPAIEGLAGMDLDVVESHFVRFRKFRPTVEVYRAAVEAVKEEAASKGEPVRNPEAALYGKLKQWTLGKWRPSSAPSAPTRSGLKTREEVEKELYGA